MIILGMASCSELRFIIHLAYSGNDTYPYVKNNILLNCEHFCCCCVFPRLQEVKRIFCRAPDLCPTPCCHVVPWKSESLAQATKALIDIQLNVGM